MQLIPRMRQTFLNILSVSTNHYCTAQWHILNYLFVFQGCKLPLHLFLGSCPRPQTILNVRVSASWCGCFNNLFEVFYFAFPTAVSNEFCWENTTNSVSLLKSTYWWSLAIWMHLYLKCDCDWQKVSILSSQRSLAGQRSWSQMDAVKILWQVVRSRMCRWL